MSWLDGDALELLAHGLLLTVILTAVTSVLSLFIGVGIGTMRLFNKPFYARLAAIYVDIFRNIPALVLIIFFAFALPNIVPIDLRQRLFFENMLVEWGQLLTGLSLPYYFLAAAVALTLNTSAYLAELFRAGVGAIPQDVRDAARTLGASQSIVYRDILLPQGFRAAFPAITNRLIHNMKNTALAAFVAVPEYFHATQAAITRTFEATGFLLLAAVVYLALSAIFAAFLDRIERRLNPQIAVSVKTSEV